MNLKLFFRKFIYPYFTLFAFLFLITFTIWFPFIFHLKNILGLKIQIPGFFNLYKNYDGPLYILVGKSFYQPDLLKKLAPSFNPFYFSAHFPLYPWIINFFSPVFGYLKSMLFTNLFFTYLLGVFFYFLLKKFKLTKKPLILVIVFLSFPRFLIIHSVGAPESIFIFFILLSLYFFEKNNYFFSGLFGGLATMTKSPGVLLFVAYSFVFLERYFKSKEKTVAEFFKKAFRYLWLLLIPGGLLVVFFIYQKQYGDFFAYFKSGDNIHLLFPFAVFNFQKNWIGTAWLEDILFYFFLYGFSLLSLKNIKQRSFFYFSLIFLTAIIFVQHRDIARYSLPLWPLACIALEKFFTSKKFLIIFILLFPAVILYSWNFILYNQMPIADWLPYL